MTEVRAPRSGRSLSSSKVTVATSQKRQAKNAPFKFLRKDEGRLSYSCALDSPTSAGGPTSQGNSTSNRELLVMDRRRSRSLREAIANDMRKGKVNDPFGSMVVAVPKRALPLTSALPSEDHPSPDRAPLQESWPSPSPQPPQHQSGAVPVAAMEPTQRETNGGQMVIERPSDLCESDEGDTVVERHLQRPQQQQLQQSRPHHTRQEGQPVLHQAQSVQQPVGHRIETVRSHSSMGYTAEGTPRDLSPAVSQQRRWRNGDRESIAPLRPQSRRYNDMCDLEDDYSRSNRNYFRAPMPEYRQSREEVEIVGQLEDELHAAKEERSRYYQLRMQLERERQRFEEYRSGVEQDIEDERAELDAVRASEKRQAKKDVKVVEERYKSTLELLKTERESNAKLTQENEVLRQHLEVMTARLRESQKLQKVETNRLRREIESLTRRNEELLELARDQQLAALESGAMLVTPPLTHAIPNTRYQVMSSNSGIQRSSVESYEAHSFAVQPGRSNAQHQRHYKDLTESDQGLVGNKAEGRRVVAGGSERGGEVDGKRFEEEEEDCEGRRSAGAEAEERERKRVELEERRRVDAEEKERKRIEAEERERKRVELEERRRVDAEEKERKRIEAEERERKRVELEERRRVDAEEKERKRIEAEERERKRVELEERRRADAEERERKKVEAEERRLAEAEERRRAEAEEKARKLAEVEEEKRRKAAEAMDRERKLRERSESARQQQDAKEEQKKPQEEGAGGRTQDFRQQRRSAGHPVLTPRAQNTKVTASPSLSLSRVSATGDSLSRKVRRAPTAAELTADSEPVPPDDFAGDAIVSQTPLGENPNKREVLYRSGKREIHYTNGTRKIILPQGHVVLYFTNGDIKRTFPSGKSTYWYAAAQTTHTQYADGTQVFQFHSTGQVERHMPDGKKEILYPDGIYKVVHADGRDETVFPDVR